MPPWRFHDGVPRRGSIPSTARPRQANTLGFIKGGQPIEGLPHISTSFSLGVIVGILVITTVASLIRSGMVARRAAGRSGDVS